MPSTSCSTFIASIRPLRFGLGRSIWVMSRDHRLGVEAQAGDKHLHLLAGGVLRLVEYDKGVVERAPAHEGDWSNLDDVLLQEAVHLLRFQQVVKSVVERAEVGIHFF